MANKTKRKVRSKFRVAMSHIVSVVIFTLIFTLIMTLAIGMLASGLSPKLAEGPQFVFVVIQCCLVMGVAAATYYSMSSIRRTCIMYDPLSYIKPCIIAGGIVTLAFMLYIFLILPHIRSQQGVEALGIVSPMIIFIIHVIHYLVYTVATCYALKNMTPDVRPNQQPVVASK